ncbi:MAG: hypothetical protein IKZ95_05565 [Lachnospiraceae bacterium]|nr:hypothetical protein [Lachnospiraceae bacterium]
MGSLIDEIRSGNKDAVKAVYQEYAKDVYNFAKSITGDHDSALAATKKTFVKLFNNIKKGDNPDNIRTALLKVAYDEACSIAMPAKEEEDTAKTIVPTPIEETQAPREAQREEIYMPKGGYESLQVEEEAVEEVTDVVEEVEEEIPRPRRPRREDGAPRQRRPRPQEEDLEEEAPRPRKKRPVEDVEDEVEEEIPRKRRPRPQPEAEEAEEVEEAPRSRKRNRKADEEDFVPSKKRRADDDVDVYDALDDEESYEDEFEDETGYEKPRNKGLFIFCIILNVILILILLWFLGGLLINLGILPEFDIGYSWFNAHIYPLF